ncbi:MAG: hypothetical protein J7K51_05555 [Thermotogae bacterium]|nr:hypothetical protein [Thermotogota bacterium]
MDKIYELSQRAEEYNTKVMSLYYNDFSDPSAENKKAAVMKNYPELYSSDTVFFLKDLRDKVINDEKRITEYLLHFVVRNLLDFNVSSQYGKLIESQNTKVTEIEDKSIPFRQLPILISTTPDRMLREKYDHAFSDLLKQYEDDYVFIVEKQFKMAKELGYKNYIDMVIDIKKIDVTEVKENAERFLKETEESYSTLLEYFAEKYLQMRSKDMTQADMNYLLQGQRFNKLFTIGRLMDTVKKTLLSMGIDMDSQKNITLDVEDRKMKFSRAFVTPIRIPSDIRLVLQAKGGFENYKTTLHESGHLEHFANADGKMNFALRALGDRAVSEMYAFLIQYFTISIEWCEEMMGFSDLNFLNFALFDKMYSLRRCCARVLYEIKLYSADKVEKIDEVYSNIFSNAVKVKYNSNRYLYDLDMNFHSMENLRAWFGETQLRSFFLTYFGRYWFENYHAGKMLKRLWHYGTKYKVDEILRMLGIDNIRIEPTIRDLSRIVI